MLPDPKSIAIGILGKGKPPPDDDDGGGDSLETAAQDFLDAVKAGSAKDLADAFRSMSTLVDQPE